MNKPSPLAPLPSRARGKRFRRSKAPFSCSPSPLVGEGAGG